MGVPDVLVLKEAVLVVNGIFLRVDGSAALTIARPTDVTSLHTKLRDYPCHLRAFVAEICSFLSAAEDPKIFSSLWHLSVEHFNHNSPKLFFIIWVIGKAVCKFNEALDMVNVKFGQLSVDHELPLLFNLALLVVINATRNKIRYFRA